MSKRLNTLGLLLFCGLLIGCSHRFQEMESTEADCSSSSFPAFADCLTEKLKQDLAPQAASLTTDKKNGGGETYENPMLVNYVNDIQTLKDHVANNTLSELEAFESYNSLRTQYQEKEVANNKSAGEVGTALVILGAAGAIAYGTSQSGDGGGGGYYTPQTNYQGCCSWHGGVAYCNTFTRRLICQDGQPSPKCEC